VKSKKKRTRKERFSKTTAETKRERRRRDVRRAGPKVTLYTKRTKPAGGATEEWEGKDHRRCRKTDRSSILETVMQKRTHGELTHERFSRRAQEGKRPMFKCAGKTNNKQFKTRRTQE